MLLEASFPFGAPRGRIAFFFGELLPWNDFSFLEATRFAFGLLGVFFFGSSLTWDLTGLFPTV